MVMKVCMKCFKPKPLNDFYKHPQMTDGRVNKCKECNKTENRINRTKNVDHYRQYDRDRFQDDPIRRESIMQTAKVLRERYPEKYKARTAVGNAVRDGRLIKPNVCSMCDSPGRIEGHHEDYSKLLDVIWVCPSCHSEFHPSCLSSM